MHSHQTQHPEDPESAGSPPGAQQSAVRIHVSDSAGAQTAPSRAPAPYACELAVADQVSTGATPASVPTHRTSFG